MPNESVSPRAYTVLSNLYQDNNHWDLLVNPNAPNGNPYHFSGEVTDLERLAMYTLPTSTVNILKKITREESRSVRIVRGTGGEADTSARVFYVYRLNATEHCLAFSTGDYFCVFTKTEAGTWEVVVVERYLCKVVEDFSFDIIYFETTKGDNAVARGSGLRASQTT